MSPFIASSLTTVMKPETEASMNIELNSGVMLTGMTASECRMEQLASLVMKAKCPPVISPVHHKYYKSVSVYTTVSSYSQCVYYALLHRYSVLFFSRHRSEDWPCTRWTYFLQLSLSSVILIDSSTRSPDVTPGMAGHSAQPFLHGSHL